MNPFRCFISFTIVRATQFCYFLLVVAWLTPAQAQQDQPSNPQLSNFLTQGNTGAQLSSYHHQQVVRQFRSLPRLKALLEGVKCVGFAVGSVGRGESVPGSDLELGLICDFLPEAHANLLSAAIALDLPDVEWDHEFKVAHHVYSLQTINEIFQVSFRLTDIWKMLDAAPVFWINCSPDDDLFDQFRGEFLTQVVQSGYISRLVDQSIVSMKGSAIEFENAVDGVFANNSRVVISGDELLRLPEPLIVSLLTNQGHGNLSFADHHNFDLMQRISIKHSFYRLSHIYVLALYLRLLESGTVSTNPKTWRTNTLERLAVIPNTGGHPSTQFLSRGTFDLILRLRMEEALRKNENNALAANDGPLNSRNIDQVVSFSVQLWQELFVSKGKMLELTETRAEMVPQTKISKNSALKATSGDTARARKPGKFSNAAKVIDHSHRPVALWMIERFLELAFGPHNWTLQDLREGACTLFEFMTGMDESRKEWNLSLFRRYFLALSAAAISLPRFIPSVTPQLIRQPIPLY